MTRNGATPAGYHALLADLEHPGCPACRSVARHARRYLDGLLYELVNDPDVRARLWAARGFICPVCETTASGADLHLGLLAQPSDSEIGRAARGSGRALCIPHLKQGLAASRSGEERRRLLDIYLRADEELGGHLDGYLRKQHYRFREEGLSEEESAAWRRAVHRVVGGW